jgi:predicted lipid-binding transport protein (Tim44 family)
MRNLILPVVLATLLVPAAPAVASSATTTASKANQAALGRGFGRRSPSFGSRSRYRSRPYSRPYRRPGLGIGRFFGGVLKFLGLAYLFHMLFGWGGGGSPLGLILLVGLIVWLATRRRRRRFAYTY